MAGAEKLLKAVSPLNLERYEFKYRVPLSMVKPIADYVSHYCEMDYHSQISPDGFYMINSLYFDTPQLGLFKCNGRGELGYSCFRIRSYGADPKPPYYLESKQKFRDFCKKRRAKVQLDNNSLRELFVNPSGIEGYDPFADKNAADFLEKCETFRLEPVVLTQYRRMAFLSVHDHYARVTFDRDLRLMEEHDYNVVPRDDLMNHYDHPDTFEDYNTGKNVILELKCERKIPLWMVELIQRFQLVHHRFSKYQTSVMDLYGQRPDVGAYLN
jgi:SPX domain protein involved in polyphosphate accumulation